MIKAESVELLKSKVDIVDVIGSVVELRKSGSNFVGRCPFHDEKTASFNVSQTRQFYHCFGCKAGGDLIKFVQDFEHLSFSDAVEKIANEHNITLEYSEKIHQKKASNHPVVVLNDMYKKELNTAYEAMRYLTDRGVTKELISRFEIGFAPNSSDQMELLRKNFISTADALDAGVVATSDDGRSYARFTNRITFPIYNNQSVLVGFGGRTISNHPAKYINSPQSTIFNKSRLLFALNLAKDEVIKTGEIIVVEGYMDVVMLHSAGITNAVATLGTALTTEHLPLIRRLNNPKIILSYDSDNAGIEAAFKASELLATEGFAGGVALLESGKDPADMISANKTDELKKIYQNPTPFANFAIDTIIKRELDNTAESRDRAFVETRKFISNLGELSKEEYARYAASQLGTDARRFATKRAFVSQKRSNSGDIAELTLIKTVATNREYLLELVDYLDIKLFDFHADIFAELNDSDQPKIRGLLIDSEIKTLDENELTSKLKLLLIRHFERELLRIRGIKNEDFLELSFAMRKIQEKIRRLKGGELVAFEEFRT